MTAEIVFMWVAVSLYAAAAAVFVVSFGFASQKLLAVGWVTAVAGLVPHAVAIGIRWVRLGHGPGLGFYEVVSSLAFVSVLVGALLVWRYRGVALVGLALMPIAFLMLGGAMLAPQSNFDLTATLASWWLTIHVSFAKLAYGSLSGAFGIAVVYLLRPRLQAGKWSEMILRLPSQEVLDDLTFKLVAVGFIFLGIMIAAGAIWANEAWGRYWGWDPIETWSLIAWIVYAVVLHLRLMMGWRDRRFAWASIAALPLVLFALIGVPLVYRSIHAAYLIGTE